MLFIFVICHRKLDKKTEQSNNLTDLDRENLFDMIQTSNSPAVGEKEDVQ